MSHCLRQGILHQNIWRDLRKLLQEEDPIKGPWYARLTKDSKLAIALKYYIKP